MSEQIKVSGLEFEKIQIIQKRKEELSNKYADIGWHENNIKQRKEELYEEHKSIVSDEDVLKKSLFEKYGNVSVNPQTGDIINHQQEIQPQSQDGGISEAEIVSE